MEMSKIKSCVGKYHSFPVSLVKITQISFIKSYLGKPKLLSSSPSNYMDFQIEDFLNFFAYFCNVSNKASKPVTDKLPRQQCFHLNVI